MNFFKKSRTTVCCYFANESCSPLRISMILIGLMFLTRGVWAIPTEVAVTGYLTESQGGATVPVSGKFPLMLTFYDGPSKTTAIKLDTVRTTATVTLGLMNATIPLPDDLLTLQAVWYEVSLDRDKNGFEAKDLFGEMVRLTSVPFALSAQPTKYYESHGGQGGYNQFGAGYGANVQGRIVMAPFCTPPGGVKFNRMAASFGFDAATSTTFGVYNDKGKLVYSSAVLTGKQDRDILAFAIEGKLKPSRMYWTALITNSSNTPTVGIIMLPNIPTRGYYPSDSQNGTLPKKIDLTKIVQSSNFRPISI